MVYAGLQTHASSEVLPGGATEFAGHVEHVEIAVAPTATEYLPCGHAVQGPPPGP